MRCSLAEIERLNARLEADNVYLKEEIKSYHDFDDIVGESTALRLALARLAQVAPTNSSVLLHRSDRNRQGAVRPRAARAEPPACASAGAGQLRGAAADAGRKRAVRPREGRLHRRRRDATGALRAGRRRDDLPGRNRRPAAGHSGQVPARAAGRRIRARGLLALEEGGRSRDCRHPSQPRAGGRRGPLPGRPVLPPERLSDSSAVAARARGRHPAARVVLHPPPPARPRATDHEGAAVADGRRCSDTRGPATFASSRTSWSGR